MKDKASAEANNDAIAKKKTKLQVLKFVEFNALQMISGH